MMERPNASCWCAGTLFPGAPATWRAAPGGPPAALLIFWENRPMARLVVTAEYGHGDQGAARENFNRAGWFCAARFDGDFAVCVAVFWGLLGCGYGRDFPLLDT